MNKKKAQIKKLKKDDVQSLQKLILVFQDVFEMEEKTSVKKSYLKKLLAIPGFVVITISFQGDIIGGLTAYELPMYYSQRSEMYIYDMAVKKSFQRKGFGTELITALKKFCKKNSIRELFVEAHEEDDHAVKFYRSAGGKAEKVVHFNFRL